MKLQIEKNATDKKFTAQMQAENGEIVWSTGSQRYNKRADAVAAFRIAHLELAFRTWQSIEDSIEDVKPAKAKRAKCGAAALAVLFFVVAAIATGCARVPVTKVTFNPDSKSIDFSGPKDVAMKGLNINWLSATATNRASFTVTMESFEAKNNIELFRAVVAQNSEMARRVSEGSANFLGTIVEHMK